MPKKKTAPERLSTGDWVQALSESGYDWGRISTDAGVEAFDDRQPDKTNPTSTRLLSRTVDDSMSGSEDLETEIQALVGQTKDDIVSKINSLLRDRLAILVMPPLSSKSKDRPVRSLAILPDGNVRAGEDYKGSGENFIDISVKLLSETEVRKVVGLILSPLNILNRDEESLEKIRKSMIYFGSTMENEGKLVDQEIGLSFETDADVLEAKGGVYKKLSETMDSLVRVNRTLLGREVEKEIVLGVNYPDDVLLKHEVDLLYRSGMTTDTMGRPTNIDMKTMSFVSDTLLFPEVTYDTIRTYTEAVNDQGEKQFSENTPYEFAFDLMMQLRYMDVDITIPFVDEPNALMQQISSSEMDDKTLIVLEDSGEMIYIGAVNDPRRIFHFTSGGPKLTAGYSTVILAGQTGRVLVLPDSTLLPRSYEANFFRSSDNPSSIVYRISEAKMLSKEKGSLSGKKRTLSFVETAFKLPDYTYIKYAQNLKGENKLTVLRQYMLGQGIELDDFSLQGILIASRFIDLLEKYGVPMEDPKYFRAAVNYILISHLIGEDPNVTYLIGLYTLGVHAEDHFVFDKFYEGELEEDRFNRIAVSARYIKSRIMDCELLMPEVEGADMLKVVSEFFDVIKSKTQEIAHPDLFKFWSESVARIASGSFREYAFKSKETENEVARCLSHRIEHPYVDEVTIGKENNSSIVERKKRLYDICINGCSDDEAYEAYEELMVFIYLESIMETIGAGQLYLTAALSIPAEEVTDEMSQALIDTYVASNYLNRLANDLAGYFRSQGDEDQKENCFSVLFDKKLSRRDSASYCDNEIATISKLVKMYRYLEQEFDRAAERLKEIWPRMSRVVERGRVGVDIYKETHFDDLSLEDMLKIYYPRIRENE